MQQIVRPEENCEYLTIGDMSSQYLHVKDTVEMWRSNDPTSEKWVHQEWKDSLTIAT